MEYTRMVSCRTCLSRHDLSPLFGEDSVETFSAEQLFSATGVKIEPNDGLPQSACKLCVKRIKKTLDFQELSSKVDRMLREFAIKHPVKMEDGLGADIFYDNVDNEDIFNSINISSSNLAPGIDDCTEKKTNSMFYDDKDHVVEPIFVDNIAIHYDSVASSIRDNEKEILEEFPQPIQEYMKKASTNVKNLINVNKKLNDCKLNFKNISKSNQVNDGKFYKSKLTNNREMKSNNKLDVRNKLTKEESKRKFCNPQVNIKASAKPADRYNSLRVKDFKLLDKNIRSENNTHKRTSSVPLGKEWFKPYHSKLARNPMYLDLDFFKRNSKLLNKREERNKLLMSLASPRSDGTIACKQCTKVVRRTSFKTHAKTHFEPEFPCQMCDKKFFGRGHLNYHQQRRHGKEKRLQCPHCPFRAVDRFCIRNHVRAEHTGERPYVCDVCGMSFRMRNNIIQHMHSHFGVRNMQCELCPAAFTRRSQLWGHQMKTHFIDYTYHCYLCPETYRHLKPVRNHLASAHGVPRDQQRDVRCVKTRKPEAPSSNSVGSKSFIPDVTS